MVAVLSVQHKPSWTEQAGQMLTRAGQFYGQVLVEGGSIPPSSRALWEVRLLLWGAAVGSGWALLDSAAAYAGRRGTRHWGCLVPNAALCTVGENITEVITTVLVGAGPREGRGPCVSYRVIHRSFLLPSSLPSLSQSFRFAFPQSRLAYPCVHLNAYFTWSVVHTIYVIYNAYYNILYYTCKCFCVTVVTCKCFVNGDTQKGNSYSTDDLEEILVQASLWGASCMWILPYMCIL